MIRVWIRNRTREFESAIVGVVDGVSLLADLLLLIQPFLAPSVSSVSHHPNIAKGFIRINRMTTFLIPGEHVL